LAKICSVKDCKKSVKTKGYCKPHYDKKYAKENELHLKEYRRKYWGSTEVRARLRKQYADMTPVEKEEHNRKNREQQQSEQGKATRRKHYHNTKDARHAERKRGYEKVKLDVFTYYSKKISGSNVPCCAFCKETEFLFLTIDHIDGRKTAQEKRGIMKSDELYRKLRQGWPDRYQVLCYNCNMVKEIERPKIKKNASQYTTKYRKHRKAFNDQRKSNVLSHYSNGKLKCVCCGYKKLEGLSIDHISGRININHPKNLSGGRLYAFLEKNNYPPRYQTLCFNCNAAKGHHKICPHQLKR